MFSVETWQAIQLATGWNPGGLAPYNTRLIWGPTSWRIPRDLLQQAFPYLSLFLSPSTLSINFTMSSQVPVQVGSLHAASDRPLKELQIHDTALQADAAKQFIDSYLTSYPWHSLQTLSVANISTATLTYITRLPSLTTLHITNMPIPPEQGDTLGKVFPSLQSLVLYSDDIAYFAGLLRCLSQDNQIHTLKLILTSYTEDKDPAAVIQAVSDHCNPQTLRSFVLRETTSILSVDEPLDVVSDIYLDLSPLFPFGNLETLSINLTHEVVLDSDEITTISSTWPKLKKLKIDVDFPNSRVPLIDHNDILTLLYNCRHLKKLGLRFDGTRIEGDEPVPNQSTYNEPAHLKKLWVSDSPILSPSAVASFLQKHCPHISEDCIVHIWKVCEGEDDVPADRFNALYGRRWWKVEGIMEET